MNIQKVCIYKYETICVCINVKYMQDIKLNIRILTEVTLTFLQLCILKTVCITHILLLQQEKVFVCPTFYVGTKGKDNQHKWKKKELGGELAFPRLVIVC